MTIQDYFYSLENKTEEFPTEGNYVSNYKTFKDFMDANIHPEIKTVTSRLDDEIFLNDHSTKHVEMVILKISQVLECIGFQYISGYEYFILLTAVQIHDAGHIINGRENHSETGKKFLEFYNKYSISAIERRIIHKIAAAHSGKHDPIGNLEALIHISGIKVRPKLLASLLRLGDELADENSRASKYLLDLGRIPEYSKLFHVFSRCLDTYLAFPESGTIHMHFYISKQYATETFKKKKGDSIEEVYLVDEIYTRSIKAFTECMYYNRFVPDELRFRTINVDIDFLEDNGDDYYDSISYRIEEKGYPQIISNDIFTLVKDQLVRDGNQLTGKYINSIICRE